MSYRLVIPSRERAKWLMSQTKNTLKYTYYMYPRFMVRNDDSQMEDYFDLLRPYGITPMIYDGANIWGAAQTYDMIIEHAIADGVERLLILDDDLHFVMHTYKKDGQEFIHCDQQTLPVLFEHITSLVCAEMPMLSFTPIMTRSLPNIIEPCKPMMMAYSIYIPFFKDNPQYRFWMGKHIEARCDLNLTLRLLTEGYLTGFMRTCFIPDNVNNPGGCSTYRFLEIEKQSVAYLKATFPDYVSTSLKRGWMGDDTIEREAPRIQWRQAFNSGLFCERFGVDASVWMQQKIQAYDKTYAAFIKELRNETY